MDNTLNTITTHQVTAGSRHSSMLEIVRLNMCFVRAFVCSVGRGNSSHTQMWGISSHRNLQKNRKR